MDSRSSLPVTALVRELTADHAGFGPPVEGLVRLADECSALPAEELHTRLREVLTFLDRRLLPHAAAEEAVLYPAVAQLLGAPEASATMVRDHVEIRRLVRELRHRTDELGSPLAPVARRELVQTLYALHAVLSLHLAKEDELYLPVLARELDENRSIHLLRSMQEAASAADADGLAADGG